MVYGHSDLTFGHCPSSQAKKNDKVSETRSVCLSQSSGGAGKTELTVVGP
jgi:hypothetical protein